MIAELFRNPITIIFGLLAVFFTLMGLGRHLIRKRNLRSDGPVEKPYKVSDPYAEPDVSPDVSTIITEKSAKQTDPGAPAPKRYFKEFAGTAKTSPATSGNGSSGYVWE